MGSGVVERHLEMAQPTKKIVILITPIPASCYWENVDVNVGSVRAIPNVFTAYDCQSICAAASDCYYFTYDKIYFNCHIKGTTFSTAYNTQFTSGPKTCSDCK